MRITIMIEHDDHYSKTVEEPYIPQQLDFNGQILATPTVREVAERVLERALKGWE
jgi:hypothetical protein